MARQGFLHDNTHRVYPFLPGRPTTFVRSSDSQSVELPDSFVADFGCATGLDVLWDAAADEVRLTRITRNSTDGVEFAFEATAYGLAGYSLVFRCRVGDPELTTVRSVLEVHGSSADAEEDDCGDDFLWEGVLTVGDPAKIAVVLGPDQELVAQDGSAVVEPARIQDLGRTYVRSLNAANVFRIGATAPDGCPAYNYGEYRDGDVVVSQRCMTGVVSFKEGYNCALSADKATGTMTISAAVGAGDGEPCGEVKLYPAHSPPGGSILLSGGPACGEVVSSVNGVSSSELRIVQGSGVTIKPDPDHASTLVVTVDLNDLTACPGYYDSSL